MNFFFFLWKTWSCQNALNALCSKMNPSSRLSLKSNNFDWITTCHENLQFLHRFHRKLFLNWTHFFFSCITIEEHLFQCPQNQSCRPAASSRTRLRCVTCTNNSTKNRTKLQSTRRHIHWHQLATKSKFLNSWCSASDIWRFSFGGVNTAFSPVNSLSKLLTSSGWR